MPSRRYPAFSLIFLHLAIIFTVVIAHSSPLSPDRPLVSINSSSELTSFLERNHHAFVKFFNPSCPHCRAMAAAYVNLSHLLYEYNQNVTTPENKTVACLEVDLSASPNRALLDQYDISRVPTLLFFHSNSSYDEYAGARTAEGMFLFIQDTLRLMGEPGTPHFRSEEDVSNFLELVDQRPIVLSVLHAELDWRQFFMEDVQLPFTEWLELTSATWSNSRPMFATVEDPSLLVLSGEPCYKRYEQQFRRLSYSPIAVAAPSAASFCEKSFWYYPGVKDSESLSSFVHTSIIRRRDYIKLTSENSRHIINADRPLIFVFGKTLRPSYNAQYILLSLSKIRSIRPVVPVYVSRPSFPDLADYLHLPHEANESRGSSTEHDVVLYYYGNMGPIIRNFKPGGSTSLSKWTSTEALALNKATVSTVAGHVLVLNETTWSGLFDFDARVVLLLLTENDRGSYKEFLESVAQILQPHSGSIVVARYDAEAANVQGDGEPFSGLPASNPDLSDVSERPALVLVAPGEGVRRYEGRWTTRAVARFVRRWTGVNGNTTQGVVGEDVAIASCFLLGLVLIIFGLVTSRQWPTFIGNYWQKLKGNGESGSKRL